MMHVLFVLIAVRTVAASPTRPHIIQVVADDLGYDDLGHDSVMGNGGVTHSPNINALMDNGIILHDYYTFKVCSPSRASLLTGRYPWGAGFYDMSDDSNHCTSQFTLLPELMRSHGYSTHALGKWDVGYVVEKCTPTFSGFDTYLGYYSACLSDYWYHWSPEQCDGKGPYVDLSNSTSGTIGHSQTESINGTYNAHVFTAETIRLLEANVENTPMYIYLAYQNVHLACSGSPKGAAVQTGKPHGLQAPCGTVDMYSTQAQDVDKVQGAMVTELDYGVGNVTNAFKAAGQWANTVLFLVSDNGAQLDHGYNSPLRGGKHTFFEGGVRVACFISSPLIPEARQGTVWTGMAHSSDWYLTVFVGMAGGALPSNQSSTGPRPPDGFNLWPALLSGGASPRNEVVHQVDNSHFSANNGTSYMDGKVVSGPADCDGSCGVAIRVGEMKLIKGLPGDQRWMKFPAPKETPTPFGQSGGVIESGTDHCRTHDSKGEEDGKYGYYLFNLTADLAEENNLATDPAYLDIVKKLEARIMEVGADGPPPAYVFPKGIGPTSEADAKRIVCSIMQMQGGGFLEPSDSVTHPPLPPPPPSPPPPPPPGPLPPAAAQCEKAGGIISSSGKDKGKACCAKSCGTCGGKQCGKEPGGNANCCTGDIVAENKPCTSNPAPCTIVSYGDVGVLW